MQSDAAKRLLERWDNFNAGNANYEEAYNNLAKYARDDWEALRSALSSETDQGRKVDVHYAYCCSGSTKYCDCVNKSHGTAWIGANEVGDDYIPVVTPAPAVSVKALEWYELTSPREDGPAEPTGDWEASCGFGEYSVCLDQDEEMSETPWCAWSPENNEGHFSSVEEAKAAAQADYEARIRSALSAQVQDVAEDAGDAEICRSVENLQDVAWWQEISTGPKDGSSVLGFWSYTYPGDKEPTTGIEIIEWYDGKFQGWKDRDGVTQDGVYTHWMPLPSGPAAPAKQEG